MQASGENNTTWGTHANQSVFTLVDTSLDGFATLALVGATSTLAITDGAASNGRNRVLICTGALAADHTITVTPNDAQKLYFVENATTGGYSVKIAQGGGAGTIVTVPAGVKSIVRVDGTGSNANAYTVDSTVFPVVDTTPVIKGSSDATKLLRFEVDGLTTGTTRVLTAPDFSGVIACTNQAQTFTGNQTFSSPPFLDAGSYANDGSAANPSYTFFAEIDTGIYLSGVNAMSISTGGTERVRFDANGQTQFPDGTAGAPSITNSGDVDTGIYFPAANTVGVTCNGAAVLSVITAGLEATGYVLSKNGTINMRLQAGAFGAGGVGTFSNDPVLIIANSAEVFRFLANGSITSSTGASLTSGGAWTNASDASLKFGFGPIEGVAEKLAKMPIGKWRYKHEPEAQHVGPTAQDFHTAFGLGGTDLAITTVDGIGIALAAIKEVILKLAAAELRILALENK